MKRAVPTGRAVLLGAQSEADWQRQVLEWARRGGWHGYHVYRSSLPSRDGQGGYSVYSGIHDGRNADHDDRKGILDLHLIHPSRGILLMPELKSTTGRVSSDQERWLAWLEEVREVHAEVWRPQDFERVRRLLTGV